VSYVSFLLLGQQLVSNTKLFSRGLDCITRMLKKTLTALRLHALVSVQRSVADTKTYLGQRLAMESAVKHSFITVYSSIV